jgi:hypothetical protein
MPIFLLVVRVEEEEPLQRTGIFASLIYTIKPHL